jgi:Bacterial Ig domain
MTVSSNHPCGSTFRVTGAGGENVLLKVVSKPGNGAVTTDGIGTYAYTSNPDFKGQDSFTLHSAWFSNKTGTRAEADFTVNVTVK